MVEPLAEVGDTRKASDWDGRDWTCRNGKVPCLVKRDGRKRTERRGQRTEGGERKSDWAEVIRDWFGKGRRVIVGSVT